MRKYLIYILLFLSIAGYAQTAVDPATTPTTTRINNALGDAVTATGTNTYAGTYAGLANVANRGYAITFTNANTTAATFNLNGSGAVTLKKFVSGALTDLVSGDIAAGETKKVRYNGTYLIVENPTATGGGGGGVSSVTGTSTRITSTGGTTPVIDIDAAYPGQTSITTVGTINTGVWQASGIPPTRGGTGQSSIATGDLLVGGATANTWSRLVAGTNGYTLQMVSGSPAWVPGGGGSGITALTGDVTASGTGSVAASVVKINGNTVPANAAGVLTNNGSGTLTWGAAGSGGGSGTLNTITSDPFNLPASSTTIDVFAGRTLGNLQNIYSTYTLPVVTVNNKIVVDGNSNGYGTFLTDTSKRYGSLVRSRLGTSNYAYKNFAVPGQTTQQLISRQSTTLAAFNATKSKNYMVAFEIENDAFINTGLTPLQLKTNMKTWYAASKAAGFYTIATTSPQRAYFGTGTIQTNIDINNNIAAANALLLADNGADEIINLSTIPRLANQRSRTGYWYDDVHFNTSAHSDLANKVITRIRTNLGQTDYTPPHYASYDGNSTNGSMIIGPTNRNVLGLLGNGKVVAETSVNGAFIVNGDAVPDDSLYQYAVGTKQVAGLMVTPGLTAHANNDILSALTIQPPYFDIKSYTGTITDMFRIQSYMANGYGNSLLRVDKDGRFISSPTFTAGVGDISRQWSGTITGQASGNYTGDYFGQTVNVAANNTTIVGANFANTINRGAFTGTVYKAAIFNSGSNATTSDAAVEVTAVEGTGISIPNHAGTGTAINVVSSSSSNGLAVGMSNASAIPIVAYKSTGSTKVMRLLNLGSTNSGGIVEMANYERAGSGQTSGVGMSFNHYLFSTTPNNRNALERDVLFVDNTDAAEKSAEVWKTYTGGNIVESFRIEGSRLSVGYGTSPTARVHIRAGSGAAGSAPIKLSSFSITTTGASGNGTLANITFATQATIPFEIGGTVTIAGVTPSGYNGTFTVTAATTTSVSFANATTGVQTVAGTASTGLLATPENGAIEFDGTHYYATIGSTRYQIDQQTSGTVVTGDATDADFTMLVNTAVYLPTATLTANRTITIPTGANGDRLEILNNEKGFVWNLTGGAIYYSDGVTTMTSLLADTNYIIRKISGKWRILN